MSKRTLLAKSALLLSAAAFSTASLAQSAPTEGFAGKIGATRAASIPAFPQSPQAPKGAPNVLIVLLDDVGFAATSAFGGAARTPNIEALAAEGVRYNRFHTTAICSPTRAALLTGRNQHQVGFGNLMDVAAGFPAYNSVWKQETATVARVLHDNGYSTAAFGKWHNTPRWEVSAAGPFDHWPTHLGFDHWYGFQGGEDNQWEPHLYNDTTQVEAPAKYEDGYHLTNDLVNKAVGWVDDHNAVAAAKPYFLYFATGATHMPHDVPQTWIEKNKGRFDAGWDAYRDQAFAQQKKLGVIPADTKLTPRPEGLPAWDSLSPDQKHLYAHEMEVYSAYLEHTDFEVGRLVKTLQSRPGGDNLLIFYIIGDNGGSAEGGLEGSLRNESAIPAGKQDFAQLQANYANWGGPNVASHYAAGWAWATTTPFQWMKQVASHFGGTRDPLIVSWPGHTSEPGEIRSQFGHVNDITPTILDAAHISFPAEVDGVKQIPLEGHSLLPTFTNPKAPESHPEQYFEIFGNRAIYKDGWVAAAKRSYDPWNLLNEVARIYTDDTANDRWELYNVDKDFSEANDLAKTNPRKLAELKAEFIREGTRNGVFPLIPLPFGAPSIIDRHAKSFTYQSDISTIPQAGLPIIAGKPHRIEVDIKGDASVGSGVLLADGGRLGGFVLYEKNGHLVFENNAFGQSHQSVTSTEALPSGPVTVAYDYTPETTIVPNPNDPRAQLFALPQPGTVRLFIGGKQVGEGHIGPFSTAAAAISEGFDIGQDRGSQVSRDSAGQARYSQSLGETRLTLR